MVCRHASRVSLNRPAAMSGVDTVPGSVCVAVDAFFVYGFYCHVRLNPLKDQTDTIFGRSKQSSKDEKYPIKLYKPNICCIFSVFHLN